METARLHRSVHDRVDGRVQAVYLAVYTAVRMYTDREQSLHTAAYTYTRPAYKAYIICNGLTNSCDYVRKQSNECTIFSAVASGG